MFDLDFEEEEKITLSSLTTPIYKLDAINENMPNHIYHSIDGVSSTQFDLMRKSMTAFELREHFKKSCVAFDDGQLTHDAILLPHLLDEMYLESPTKGSDTVAANKLKADNPNKIIVGQGMMDTAKEMAYKVDLIYGDFIRPSYKEVSIFHQNDVTGLLHKFRPDILNLQQKIIIDVKSSSANNHAEFLKVLELYDYDLSAAWYFDTAKDAGFDIEIFAWIVVPKQAPHCPFGFYCTPELLEKGRSKYQSLLIKYAEFKENGIDELFKPAFSWEYRKENYI